MKLNGRNKISPEFNMSSMTDIVFLLLIFFMIASTLAKQLNTIDVLFQLKMQYIAPLMDSPLAVVLVPELVPLITFDYVWLRLITKL